MAVKDKPDKDKDQDKVKIDTIQVRFKAGVTTDGQIGRVQIWQFGSMVQMTKEQARTLAQEILRRIPQ